MNTNDVRNMELTQWVFWAVALPLMFVIICLCLAWTNKPDKILGGFANLWRRKSAKRGAGSGCEPMSVTSRPVRPRKRYEDTVWE